MVLTPYQIVTPFIALIAVLYAWNLVLRQKKTIWEASLWTLFWAAIGAIALYPETLTYLSAVTGIRDRENAVLVTFLGILLFIVFYMIVRLEELEQKQTKLIRKIALRESGLEESSDSEDD